MGPIRPLGLLIAANYVSAWVGGLFLRGVIVRSLPMDITNAWSWQWVMVAVTYLLTLVLEYPFVVMALPRLPGRLRSAVWGSLVIQTVSYTLLFGWYWMASGKSLYTAMAIVEPAAIALPEGVAVYSIGAADGHVYRMDLPARDRRRVADLGSTGRMDRLYVRPSATAEGRWDLMAHLEGEDRWHPREVLVAAGVAAEAAPNWRSLQAKPPPQEADTYMNFGHAARLGRAKDSPWEFWADFWAAGGLRGEHTGTGATVRLALETPFTAWMVRNVTHLPGDAVLFQLGHDQICVLDPDRRQVALLAKGRGPTAVMAEAAAPPPPASAAAVEPPPPASAAPVEPARSPLGIGFLWTAQSRELVGRLNSAADFVDVILDPGKGDVFAAVQPPVRVACIALALERHAGRPFPGIKETIETLRELGVPPHRVIIAYNPERSPGTPTAEIDDLVASVRRAREMAQAYGAPLLVGPGLREMLQREALYPELAKHCDFWLIQSQRLQLDSATRRPVDPVAYRAGVARIVEALRQGNPRIQIIVQVVTTAERGATVLSAEQVAGYAEAVADLVDAVRVYGASGELLGQILERLRPSSGPAVEP